VTPFSRAFRRGATVAGLVVSLAACTASACRQPSGREGLLGARSRTPAPASSGSCDFDLTADKSDTVFFVLGFLNEYLGRSFVEDGDRIEGFYCNEPDKALVFQRYISRLAQEQGLDPDVHEETVQRCLISYHSRSIADRLNSCYRFEMTDQELAPGADGAYRRTAKASLSLDLFVQGSHSVTGGRLSAETFLRRRALAYVSGAWARFGRGEEFVFANAQEKATLIATLLTNLGCRGVRVESTVGLIPQGNVVQFEPTREVAEWIRKSW